MTMTAVDQVAVATMGDVLTDTMDMTQTGASEAKPFDIAAIEGVRRGDSEHLDSYLPKDELTLRWDNGLAILSAPRWNDAGWQLRLSIMQAALAIFSCIAGAPDSHYQWLSSGKRVRQADAAGLLGRWIEAGAPPVMDFIDFVIEDNADGKSIMTRGLNALIGYEIAAQVGTTAPPELARMVGRLAQAVLTNGAVGSDAAVGPDGAEYRLTLIAGSVERLAHMEITEKIRPNASLA